MTVFYNKDNLSQYLKRIENSKIALVPTMGALHDGHLKLVEKALLDNDLVVVSIFVNPTQFNSKEDLNNYPRTLDRDIELLKTVSKDNIKVYTPNVNDMYPDDISSESFDFNGLELEMEGRFRPGHFNGVGTIVKRLIELVKPDKAYFGEKDFQQLRIIQTLVSKYHLNTVIIPVPIHRDNDGLAMSSRNRLLLPEYRKAAPFLHKTLKNAKEKFGTISADAVIKWVNKQFENHEYLQLEYFIIADEETLKPIARRLKSTSYRAFIAVYAGNIRLIDNIALN